MEGAELGLPTSRTMGNQPAALTSSLGSSPHHRSQVIHRPSQCKQRVEATVTWNHSVFLFAFGAVCGIFTDFTIIEGMQVHCCPHIKKIQKYL